MKITVAGLGCIGLPTAAILAENGHEVVGYDVDKALVARLASGRVDVAERGVRDLVQRALASGRLHPSSMPYPADAFIVCVPTPTVARRPDLRAVEAAFSAIAPLLQDGSLVMLESTVPPGTTAAIAERVFEPLGLDLDAIHLAHCPERVLPGNIVDELLWNDRIVGGRRPIDAEMARAVYATFARGDIHTTDLVTAETVKIVENAYRDVNIAFANELAMLAEELGIDAWESIALANRHPRVNILKPGPGVGGHCIPVDPQFLSNANPFVTELIQTARRVNERMPHFVSRRIAELVPPLPPGRKIALLGAAYKADVDDARESPCEHVDACLRERGFTTAIYDPHVRKFSRPLVPTLEDALAGADAAVLLTDHRAFAEIDPIETGMLMRSRILLDTRHFLNEEAWRAAGFDFYVLGKQHVAQAVEAVA